MESNETDPFATAIAAGIAAGRNRSVSRDFGGLQGLERLADRFSDLASDALMEGLRRLGLEADPAVTRQDPTTGGG